ncbi:hypothetical protein QJS10_CPB11g01253 [Acorus calamus]|uniref:Myb/SANT-like domain-containing protein n=1 Tax=Acorus calamus TaxID=4465 RepID=A0AAV9DTC6_ACOCL|nr:hypothetical protein QJS10_CPB11g01253 [Acorus calamus]
MLKNEIPSKGGLITSSLDTTEGHQVGGDLEEGRCSGVIRRSVRLDRPIASAESTNMSRNPVPGPKPNASKQRIGNWTQQMDSTFVGLLVDHYNKGDCIKGTFHALAWKAICESMNQTYAITLEVVHCKNRFKVLKGMYNLYNTLANHTGWGWDATLKMAVPGDARDWQIAIHENKKFGSCQNKPFIYYDDLQMICGTHSAQGFHGVGTGEGALPSRTQSPPEAEEEDDDEEVPQRNSMPQSYDDPNSQDNPWMSECERTLEDLNVRRGEGEGSSRFRNLDKRPVPPVVSETVEEPTVGNKKASTSSGKRKRNDSVKYGVAAELVDVARQKVDAFNRYIDKEKFDDNEQLRECLRILFSYDEMT